MASPSENDVSFDQAERIDENKDIDKELLEKISGIN